MGLSTAFQTYRVSPDCLRVKELSSATGFFLVGSVVAGLADWRKEGSFSAARKERPG